MNSPNLDSADLDGTDVRTEDLVAARLGEVLGVSARTALETPSLFDLPGFDSVAVVSVMERLEDELGVEIPPELIVPEAFESVTSLTKVIEASHPGGDR